MLLSEEVLNVLPEAQSREECVCVLHHKEPPCLGSQERMPIAFPWSSTMGLSRD